MESSNLEASERSASLLRRVVIVADNSLIVEAIRIGFRTSGEFKLLGHADARTTSASTVVGAGPDVVLLDDMCRDQRAVELIREIRALDAHVAVIVLSVHMEADWLEQVFDAGATGAISKATQPLALPTLVRETLNGHIFHVLRGSRALQVPATPVVSAEGLALTDRELEILRVVAAGLSNGEVARRLWVTEQTVKFHLRNIYRKLDVANRTEASHFAHMNGLVTLQPKPPEPALTLAS
jgi:DNA-binding NarL/FixJ family response regulator